MHGDQRPEVCVIGLGYIGLPTAAVIARANCQVTGIEVSDHVVDTINRGEIHDGVNSEAGDEEQNEAEDAEIAHQGMKRYQPFGFSNAQIDQRPDPLIGHPIERIERIRVQIVRP